MITTFADTPQVVYDEEMNRIGEVYIEQDHHVLQMFFLVVTVILGCLSIVFGHFSKRISRLESDMEIRRIAEAEQVGAYDADCSPRK